MKLTKVEMDIGKLFFIQTMSYISFESPIRLEFGVKVLISYL